MNEKKFSTFDFLNTLIDGKVEITLISEKLIKGKLLSYDSNLNVVIKLESEEKPQLIRGSNILFIK
jgi:small nuclear ribonucleoprotein (snRNP)-like protein